MARFNKLQTLNYINENKMLTDRIKQLEKQLKDAKSDVQCEKA